MAERPRAPAGGLLVVACLVASACGSPVPVPSQPAISTAAADAGTPSAAPSATPAATPSPTPDPLAALQATLSRSSWSSHAVVSGTLTVASKPYAIDGSLDVSGLDTHEIRTVKLAGTGAGEWLTAGGKRFVRSAAGLWFNDAATATADDLRKFLSLASGFTRVGPSTATTGAADHFQLASAALGPRALGLNLAVATPLATLDVDADADGVPLELRVSAKWSATMSGKRTPVDVAVTYAFDPTMRPTVSAPDEVWAISTSKLYKYRLGLPEAWRVFPATKLAYVDEFDGDEYLYVNGTRERSYGDSLGAVAKFFRTHASILEFKNWRFVSMKNATVDGVPARVITAHAVDKSDKLTVVLYVAVRGPWAYEITVVDQQGKEAAEAAFAKKVMSTFRFPR